MNCPKCKTKVSKDDTVCPNCNLKLIFKCPRCSNPTRLGSVKCDNCGYTFVKFCPACHSANYATSQYCRKCHHEFKDTKEINEAIITKKEIVEKAPPLKKPDNETPKDDKEKKQELESDIKLLHVYVDFTNIEDIFEKYDTDEFKQKVVQNIETTVKIAFSSECEFLSDRTIRFKFGYSKTNTILDKIEKFEEECEKFNAILDKTLNCGISYKFIIATFSETKKISVIPQIKLGSDKDIIVTSNAYTNLKNELSLIKIAPDAYKMIFLEKKPVFEEAQDVKYEKALETILETVCDFKSQIRAISLNAPRGAGKTHLLNNLYYKLNKIKTENSLIFYSPCNALTQISPYGLIQSFFTSFFNCCNILEDGFDIRVFEKQILEKLNLEEIDPESLETLANIIYPIKRDYFENILINKEITYKHLKDVFNYIKQRKNVIFIIDDFDLIDESSYGFIKHLVNEGYFEHNAKLILAYKNCHSISIYFQSNKFTPANCLNISLRTFSAPESRLFAQNLLGENFDVPLEILSQIANNAQGNIAYIEQVLQYMFERRILQIKDKTVIFKRELVDIVLPDTIDACFENRLEFLKEQNKKEYIFLTTASLLGDRIEYPILSKVFDINENEFFEIIKSLEKKRYLTRKIDDIYGFKNSLTWSYCYIKAKEEPLIKEVAAKLLIKLQDRIISTPLICPILAQIIDNNSLAFELWTKNLQFASYIGDTNIYTMAQKQSLILLESIEKENAGYIKNNICERLGKLIYKKSPLEAKDYLTNAVVAAQKNEDKNKIIDLSGYLVKSLYLIQDFTGVIDIVDNVLKYFEEGDKAEKKTNLELQIALIKTKKLEALLTLGRWEEVSSIVNAEVNPILQKHLNIFANHKWITYNEIFFSWIDSNIILAQSYCEQGSALAFELIDEINKMLQKEKGSKIDVLKVRLAYVSAIANTSRGYFKESNTILKEITKDYSYVIDNSKLVCKWNVISLINKILSGDIEDDDVVQNVNPLIETKSNIKDELFEATAYADNVGDEYSKNLLKTFLAYVYLEEKNYLKAIEISGDEMQYFSSKKIAFGALLAWYISAAAKSNIKADTYCIEICEKAVKICEIAQNNNYYFKIMFQELLSRTYLKLNDLENAQMYCDLALQGANANELLYLQVRLNSLKALIMREGLSKQADKYNYAQSTIKMYNKAIEMAKLLNLNTMVKKISKELTAFKAHCQLNRIIED